MALSAQAALKPWHSAKSRTIPVKYWQSIGLEYRFMATLEPSQQSDWLLTELQESTLLQEGSPAKTSLLPESKQEWVKERAVGYGQRLPDLLASYDPATQSWRTSQRCLVETQGDGLAEFSETWPRSGMTRNGTAYRLPNLARTITEIGSGLLPTPDCQNHRDGSVLRKDNNLASGGKHGVSLHHYVAMWPTPSVSDNRDRGNMSNPCLQRRLDIGKQLMLSQVVSLESGQLNPYWVEWLMGYPTGHTDLKG